jgi:uncharacterized protein
MATMIIDFHTHISPPKMKERLSEYQAKDPIFASLFAQPNAKIASPEDVIASMDQYGVDISIINNFGFTTMEMCHETNDYILEAVARYPKRLMGFCTIQPRAGKAALAELELCYRGGAKGIGEMMPDRQGFELDDEAVMGPIVDFAMSHKMPFLTHSSEPVGHQYPGKGDVTPDKLYRFLNKFPQLTIVLAHWGGGLPFYALMPEVKKAMANTFVDTAASVYLFRPQVFMYVADLIGAEKILFATDFPVLSQRRLVQEVKSLNLPPQTEALIMGENARKLLGL